MMNKLSELTNAEFARQRDSLNLIASENYPSPRVLELLGSVWMNKYAEGYPGKRYYAGNVHADELEEFVQSKALEVFDPTGEYGANVQVLSGSPANAMVFLNVLEPGDTVLSLDLPSGGHLSHLHGTSSWLKFFAHETYGTVASDSGYEVDISDYEAKLKSAQPKLTIIGFSAYPKRVDFEAMIKLAHEHGSLVLADIAHINGLIAAGLHDSPFKPGELGADFVSMTTHKTMRGPRGALLFAKQEYMDSLNKTVFPGTSGGPHLHQIAAVGQSLLEILGEDVYPDGRAFRDYASDIIDNCRALEDGMTQHGLEVVSPTQTHLSLVRLPASVDSLELQQKLEQIGIVTNRNSVPNDPKTPWRPSGLRLGTAALTSRGLTTHHASQLGALIAGVATGKQNEAEAANQTQQILADIDWFYTK